MSTAPFDPDVAKVITQTHEQALRVEVVTASGTFDLAVTDWSLDWDETRSPRVQGVVSVPIPDTQAALDSMDPRTMVRVRLYASYRLPSGVIDEHLVADLGLRQRRVTRSGDGGGSLTLNLASDEALVIDAAGANPSAASDETFTAPSLAAGISTLISDLLSYGPVVPTFAVGIADTGPVSLPTAPDPWDVIGDAADQYDINVYDDGDRVFRIEPRRSIAGQSVLTLTVGSNGTILESSTAVDRDDWANWVTVWYRWNDPTTGVDLVDGGYASVTGGPFRPAEAGMRLLSVVREMPGNGAAGTKVAVTLLRRMLARSRSFSITAVPAWWVRPGSTVTIQLPLGVQERHLVSRVAFSPQSMTIETRLPDTASTIGE